MESISYILECVILGIVLTILFGWLVWVMFFGEARYVKVSKSVKNKIKAINFSNKETKRMKLLLPICTIIYLYFLTHIYVIDPPISEVLLGIRDAETVIATIVYVFCMIIVITSKNTVLPDISEILYENTTLLKDKMVFCWNQDPTQMNMLTRIISKLARRDWQNAFCVSTKLVYSDKQLNLDENVLNSSEISKIKEEYPHLQIALGYDEKKGMTVSTKSRYAFNELASAKYILKLVFSAQEASEKIVLVCINEPHIGDDADGSNLDNPIQKY